MMKHRAIDWRPGFEFAALTDVGLRRPNNQDSLIAALDNNQDAWQRRGHLFIVADGMGAHAAGQVASEMAVNTVPAVYRKLSDHPPPEALREAVREANAQICSRGQASGDCQGMGTTVSALLLLPQSALAAHVGDSRVYRLRGNRLEQLTFDHSLLWEVCAAEGIPPAEAPSYIPKNVVTRSVGPFPEVEVDLEGVFPLKVDDIFLLCSDGLNGSIADKELGVILQCLPLEEAAHALLDLAILRGGADNITAIVIRITGEQPVAAPHNGSIRYDNGLGSDPPAERSLCERLGRGPYAAVDCVPDDMFAGYLADSFEELRYAASIRNWDIDWPQFNEFGVQAAAAARAADYAQAIRDYCCAVRSVFQRLRKEDSRRTAGANNAI